MARTCRGSRGFTLIELMIVIAIIAVIAAIAMPNLIEARKGSNETAAIGALRTLVSAQSLFREGDPNHQYAPTFAALANAGLIGSPLGTGRDKGYAFYMDRSPDGMHWSAVAAPAAAGRSGNSVFSIDDTNVLGTQCPPGQHLDPATGKCVPDDTLFDDSAIALIHGIDVLSAGMALPAAKALVAAVPTLSQQLLMFMDTDHDGSLTFDEALRPDLLGPTLTPLVQPLTDLMRRDLALGIANEQLPAVQLTAFNGDLLAFLNRVPPFVPGGAAKP